MNMVKNLSFTIGGERNNNDNDVHDVPQGVEVFPPLIWSRREISWNALLLKLSIPGVNNLKDFLNDVVEYETEEDNLNAKDEMVPGIDVTQKLSK